MTKKFIIKRYIVFNRNNKIVKGICSVKCPACKHYHQLSKYGWTAIVCQGCQAELYLEKHAPEDAQHG
jgi:transposase-like protein